MKKQISGWVALPFLAFAAAGCQPEAPAGGAGAVPAEDKPPRIAAAVPAEDKPPRIAAADLDKLMQEEALLLDVREPKELEELGTLEGYINIPIGQLEKRLDELPRDRLIVTA